jgi:probable rRNA maturation factor
MKSPSPGSTGPGPTVDILIESTLWGALPDAEQIIRRAITLVADAEVGLHGREAELSVLLCDDAAIADLNARWRGHDGPTNVLSFPAAPGPELPALLGDIAIAYETVAREAGEQDKPVADHLAHLAVHGFLHLLGYDHEIDREADRMERLEREVLARIGIPDPYASRDAET